MKLLSQIVSYLGLRKGTGWLKICGIALEYRVEKKGIWGL